MQNTRLIGDDLANPIPVNLVDWRSKRTVAIMAASMLSFLFSFVLAFGGPDGKTFDNENISKN